MYDNRNTSQRRLTNGTQYPTPTQCPCETDDWARVKRSGLSCGKWFTDNERVRAALSRKGRVVCVYTHYTTGRRTHKNLYFVLAINIILAEHALACVYYIL